MTLLGLDLNDARARAVSGPAGQFPLQVPLDPPAGDLPLYINLERPAAEVGHAGARIYRISPHLVCHGFLPQLQAPSTAPHPRWIANRHSLDSQQALNLVFHRLQPVCTSAAGVALSLPSYLSPVQIRLVLSLAQQHRFPLLGSLATPLALALGAYAEQPWFGVALALDIDDHALTLSTINTGGGKAQLIETRVFPHLSQKVWKERLLNALADCCVLQSRRDPRDSPVAEQTLYDQIDVLLDACRQGRMIQLGFQGTTWYQNLLVQPDQPVAFCKPLLHQLLAEVELVWRSSWPDGPPGALLVSAAAGRLPGVASALRRCLDDWTPMTPVRRLTKFEEDFGESLLNDGLEACPHVVVLADDAPARAAHVLAGHFQRSELTPGHVDVAPLPLPQPADAGPARLHFQGQDYFLNDAQFFVGSQPGCHLVFPPDDFLGVSPRHCEIVYDHGSFMLFDRSRVGTLVNDSPAGAVVLRPGDWIRLGPEGPLLRFMGGTLDRATLTA